MLNTLENSPVSNLPDDIQSWIDPQQPTPKGVSFYPAYKPLPVFFYGIGFLIVAVPLFFLVSGYVKQLLASTLTVGLSLVFGAFILVLSGAAVFLLKRGKQARQMKADAEEGRRCTGYYVSQNYFLDYNGRRVWLFPKDRVTDFYTVRSGGGGGTSYGIEYQTESGQRQRRPLQVNKQDISLLLNWLKSDQSLPRGADWQFD